MFYIDYVLILVIIISSITDLLQQKIYNSVLLPALVLALVLNYLQNSGAGLIFSLKGLVLGFFLFLPLYLLGGLGAGDVKMLSVIGALKGSEFVFLAFLLTAILGGIISLVFLVSKGRLGQVTARISKGIQVLISSRFTIWNLPTLEEKGSVSIPYGLAIALGTISTYWVT